MTADTAAEQCPTLHHPGRGRARWPSTVDDDLPWASYQKDRLPRGWGWPLTRSSVAELLREQEVVVDHLHFSLPLLPVDLSRVSLVSARIPGNAVSSLRMTPA